MHEDEVARLLAALTEFRDIKVAQGVPPDRIAVKLRQALDAWLDSHVADLEDSMPPADRDVMRALEQLEEEPGKPFRVSRAAIAVESGRILATVDCSLYRLQRDAWIKRDGPPIRRTVEILRLPKAA